MTGLSPGRSDRHDDARTIPTTSSRRGSTRAPGTCPPPPDVRSPPHFRRLHRPGAAHSRPGGSLPCPSPFAPSSASWPSCSRSPARRSSLASHRGRRPGAHRKSVTEHRRRRPAPPSRGRPLPRTGPAHSEQHSFTVGFPPGWTIRNAVRPWTVDEDATDLMMTTAPTASWRAMNPLRQRVERSAVGRVERRVAGGVPVHPPRVRSQRGDRECSSDRGGRPTGAHGPVLRRVHGLRLQREPRVRVRRLVPGFDRSSRSSCPRSICPADRATAHDGTGGSAHRSAAPPVPRVWPRCPPCDDREPRNRADALATRMRHPRYPRPQCGI